MSTRTITQYIARTAYKRTVTLEQKICPTCQRQFEGVTQRRFCSRACQAKADYTKHAALYRHKRQERYRNTAK